LRSEASAKTEFCYATQFSAINSGRVSFNILTCKHQQVGHLLSRGALIASQHAEAARNRERKRSRILIGDFVSDFTKR